MKNILSTVQFVITHFQRVGCDIKLAKCDIFQEIKLETFSKICS